MFKMGRNLKIQTYENLFSDVIRGCAFSSIGKIPTRLTNRLVPLGNKKFLSEFEKYGEDIAGVITTKDCAKYIPEQFGCVIADNPLNTAYKIHQILTDSDEFWDSFSSEIHNTAEIHSSAYIAENNVIIGKNTIIAPNSTILERTVIGDNCYVGPGSVIGSPAYEVGVIDGKQQVLPQAGGVRIGNNVTFLANVTIAKSMFPVFTEIGDECSFDNLVHVAHDCVLGVGVKMTACSMLCGRVTIGAHTYIAPNATISNGVTLGSNSLITIGSVVVKDVVDQGHVTGNFAVPHRTFLKSMRDKSTKGN